MRHRILILATCCAVFGTTGRAQQADSLRDTARVARVVVTATRTPLTREQVPASVTVLEGASLRAQGITQLADALRLAPGIAIVQTGSYGAQTSLFTRGGQSNYTKVLIDGVPLNDPGGTLDIGALTLDDVERIEIVRGPTSVVYGSDAVTGVVQLFTRRGRADWRGDVTARGGSYASYDLSASAQGPFEGGRLALGVGHHATEGIYQFNSEYRNNAVSATFGNDPWKNATASITARYTDVTAHFPTDFTGAPVDPNDFRRERRMIAGADLRQAIGRGTVRLSLTSNLGHLLVENPPNDPSDFGRTQRTSIGRQLADLSTVWQLGESSIATVGGSLERQHQTSPDTGRRNAAGYLELVFRNASTSATAGARLDHSGTYGDFGTYRISLSQMLPAAFRARASLGTAFREPSFVESFDTPFSKANPALRPERTTSWEAGIERSIATERLLLGAVYFQQRFANLIDYRFDPSGSTYENIARARADGGEIELRATPIPNISADASYTILSTRVLRRGFSTSPLATLVEGGPLLRRPRHSATAGVAVRSSAGATVDLRATYVGERDDRRFHGAPTFDTEAVTLAPYTKLDISGALPLSLLGARLQSIAATLRVDNALAVHYESVAGYATPGRVVMGGLRATF